MKKIYVNPQTTVTRIELQRMIAASPTGGTVYGTNAESGATGFSRGNSGTWDDEDEY